MAQTSHPDRLAEEITDELELAASGHGADGPGNRTVVVDRDGCVASVDGVQALAERAGYFVFATDAAEVTLVAYDDVSWKSRGAA